MKDARTGLSRTIQDSIESSPAHLTMMAGGGAIPTTWGTVASQLVEEGHVDPSLEAAQEFLGITPDDLNDPRVFQGGYQISDLRGHVLDRWTKEYLDANLHQDAAYISYITEATKPWAIDNPYAALTSLADEIEDIGEQVDAARDAANKIYRAMDPETRRPLYDTIYKEANALSLQERILTMREDAMSTGIAMPFDQFVFAIFDYQGENYPGRARIVAALGPVVDGLMQHFHLNPDVPLTDITIGEEEIMMFQYRLLNQLPQLAQLYAEAKWRSIRHLFYAASYEEHPLFSGATDHA